MSSHDRRSEGQLDGLIRQALHESVAGEEPPADVWERIRAGLTSAGRRRTTLRWSGLLQAATLLLLVLLGGAVIRQDPLTSTTALPTTSSVMRGDDSLGTSPERSQTMAEEVADLREIRSSQTRPSIVEDRRHPIPDEPGPASDSLPDLKTVQAKVTFLGAPYGGGEPVEHNAEPVERPVHESGSIWR